ncbi:MAG: exopolysaccharide biosynthesis protein [Thermoleophilaceae bacterium]|nr:exopolysaccharide biosynthesis protein [Thermoleophilaceae bacterium]
MESPRASQLLKDWRDSPGEKTLGGLIDTIGLGSFALLFIVLLGLPALPLPTGGVTHVLEVVAMILALQLIFGRKTVWMPRRWRSVEFEDGAKGKFIDGLIRTTTRLERHSKPRASWLFGHWWTEVAYGFAVLAGALAAFFAPPFTGLDTLPAMGVVILSVGVIMEDIAFAIGGALMILTGAVLEITLGDAIYRGVKKLL